MRPSAGAQKSVERRRLAFKKTWTCPTDPCASSPPKFDCVPPASAVCDSTSGSFAKRAAIAAIAVLTVVSGVPVGYVACTKTSPRSTGGMNSKPTAPSGTSSSAKTTAAPEATATATGRRSAHGSARRAYHWRRFSKPSAKRSIGFGAFQRESSDQFPASDGVMVNEMQSEVKVATTTTSANSDRNFPTVPGRNAIGRKTTTSTSVITTAAGPICVRPLIAASFGASPFS